MSSRSKIAVDNNAALYNIALNVKKGYSSFGEQHTVANSKDLNKMIDGISSNVFGADLARAARGEMNSLGTNDSLTAAKNGGFISELAANYAARAENMASQTVTTAMNTVPLYKQLGFLALAQMVITETYSKIYKTIVTAESRFSRQYKIPYLLKDGVKYNTQKITSDNVALLQLIGSVAPTIKVDVDLTSVAASGDAVAGNMFDDYNTAHGTTINTPFDFVNHQVRIVSILTNGTGAGGVDEVVPVTWISSSAPQQSGQMPSVTAAIDCTIEDRDLSGNIVTEQINFVGSVKNSGEYSLTVTDIDNTGAAKAPKLKSITFEFTLPMFGSNKSVTVDADITDVQVVISKPINLDTTLYKRMVEQRKNEFDEDMIASFNADVVTIANATRDAAGFNYFEEKAVGLKLAETNDSNLINNQTALTLKEKGFFNTLDMNVVNYGYQGPIEGRSDFLGDMLVQNLSQMMRYAQPKESTVVLFGSRESMAYVRRSTDDKPDSQYQLIGNGMEGSIGGIKLPFELNPFSVGGFHGYLIGTDRMRPKELKGYQPDPSNPATVDTNEVDINIMPRFDEQMDTHVAVCGSEYLIDKQGTTELPNDRAISFNAMYDYATYNNILGQVKVINQPTSK